MPPEFNTFNLGRVLQTAEAIKGMRRAAETDRLRDAYLGVQTRNAEQAGVIAGNQEQRAQQTQDAEIKAFKAKYKYLLADNAERDPDPIGFIQRFAPDLIQDFDQHYGTGSFEKLSPEQRVAMLRQIKGHAAAEAGIAPAVPKYSAPIAGQQGGQDVFFQTDEAGNPRVLPGVQPRPQQANIPMFVTMSPQDVADAGLPAGTAAQRNMQNGEVRVLSKRDNTSTLSQKDQTTAKLKLQTVALARQQLNDIRARFGAIKNTLSAGGGGQGFNPSVEGQAFDRAVDQMRSTLTALTRVPGVGAMSDYETKLDQAKFPSRRDYEAVTEQQIDAIDQQLSILESGYQGLLGGGQAEQQGQQQPGVVDWSQLK